jgi:hypothetical protein
LIAVVELDFVDGAVFSFSMKSRPVVLFLSLIFAMTMNLKADDTAAHLEEALVHTVFFWFHDNVSEEQRAEFYEDLKKLREIEQILHGWIGVPAPTEARGVIDASYDYSITFVFKSVATEQEYQVHPMHKEFVEKNAHLWDKVVVYDAVTP